MIHTHTAADGSYLSKHRVHDGQQVDSLPFLLFLPLYPLWSLHHLLQLLFQGLSVLSGCCCRLGELTKFLVARRLRCSSFNLSNATSLLIGSLLLLLHLLLDGGLHLRGGGGLQTNKICSNSHTSW